VTQTLSREFLLPQITLSDAVGDDGLGNLSRHPVDGWRMDTAFTGLKQ
jgi:hypothetical protein